MWTTVAEVEIVNSPKSLTRSIIKLYFVTDTTSIFGKQKKDYWSWIEMIADIAENRLQTR